MTLSRPAAFVLQASIVVFFLAGSSAPTPLYPVYQAAWGFSPVTTTLVFGVYALAVLSALFVVGSLSDYVGRRPVLLVAALLQAVTMLLFATAHGVASLLAARVLQGLATGGATGAVGAGLMDLDRQRGTVMNAIAAGARHRDRSARSSGAARAVRSGTDVGYVVRAARRRVRVASGGEPCS